MKRAQLIAVLTAATLAAPFPAMAQSVELSSGNLGSLGSSGSSGHHKQQPTPPAPSPHDNDTVQGLDVTMIGDLLGPGISDHVRVLSGDLGEMAPIGDGKEFALIFGDSFRGANLGEGEWMSPVGVVAAMNDQGRIEIKRPLNKGKQAEQLINYMHNDRGLTLLPSDIINVNGDLYLQAMWNEGVGNVLSTEIFKSTDDGKTWTSITKLPANYMGGMGNLITWDKGEDGYIYMMSSQFKRSDDVFLTRFRPADFGSPARWEHYANGTWGSEYKPVLSNKVDAGEMSLRFIDGHWVLCMFNAQTAAIEVRIADSITADWNAIKPAKVVVAGWGGWGEYQNENNFTQLYGGYITPGSTIANMDIVVSQWNTSTHRRYNSTQFNVKGLDKFFGINQAPTQALLRMAPQNAPLLGDDSVLEVTTSEVDNTEAVAPIAVLPLD